MSARPEATEGHRRAWARLAREAIACATDPGRGGADLAKAADACRRAVFPVPPFDRSNPFARLIAAARAWAAASPLDRRTSAVALHGSATECAELLERPPPARPTRAVRLPYADD